MITAVRQRPALWRRLVILPLMLAGAGVALTSPAIEARAQDVPPAAPSAAPSAQPGGIITHRDVPMRDAFRPGVPADPAIVRTDGATELFGALALGLSPLTDGEAGQVTAGIRPAIDQAGVIIDRSMADARGIIAGALAGAGAGPGQDGGGSSASVRGLIDGAVGQIGQSVTGAMGAIPTTPATPGAGGGQ